MSYHFETYYQCGDKQFHNIFQAFREQKETKHFPKFVLDRDLISRIANAKKPKNLDSKYLRDLMISRLKYLRKKYNKLKIGYSGGTDSYTILRLCVDNDIYIDETITQMSSIKKDVRTNLEYYAGVSLAKKYEGTLIGKCTELHPTEKDLEFVDDPDWFYDDKIITGPTIPFRVYSTPNIIQQAIKSDNDTIMLMGYEKPRFLVEDGKLYWTVIDSSVGEIMGQDNTVPFFLDKDNPELVVALAYATLGKMDVNKALLNNQLIGFHSLDHKKQIELLDSCGFYKTPHHFINVGLLGKTLFNFNRKSQRFFSELQKNNKQDYIEKIYSTHKKISDLYSDLPYSVESHGNLVKSVCRYSQKLEVLPDGFGEVTNT
jgi:hypothetical protein